MRSYVFLALLAAATLPLSAARAQSAADKDIARQISGHLKESGQLRNYRIGVTYQDGIASLNGTVANAEQRDTAIRLAEQVSGVSHVVSQLNFPGAGNSAGESEPRNISAAFGNARRVMGQEQSEVMHAYGHAGASGAGARPSAMPAARGQQRRQMSRGNMPLPAQRVGMGPAIQQVAAQGVYPAGGAMMGDAGGAGMGVAPVGFVPHSAGRGPSYDNANMPGYAWPSYASYPNYAALSYPQQYSPTAWPYIGPFYPYPQVPLAWRKVSLEWDDGWWFLDFSAHNSSH